MAPGVEFSDLNYLGMGLAIVASMILGFLWYSPKTPTGKVWCRGMGMDPDNMTPPPGGKMAVSMILMVIGSLLLFFMLAHSFIAYRDAYRLDEAGYDLKLVDGIMGGVFTWLGFIVPIQLNSVAFENRPWSFFFVNASYYLVMLVVAGILLVTVGA
jgi:magnesium-transporting ATPase (P-type)